MITAFSGVFPLLAKGSVKTRGCLGKGRASLAGRLTVGHTCPLAIAQTGLAGLRSQLGGFSGQTAIERPCNPEPPVIGLSVAVKERLFCLAASHTGSAQTMLCEVT